MRAPLFVTFLSLFSYSAFADCDSDAREAFARVVNSGPYHFEKLEWRPKKSIRLIGSLIPGERMHFAYDGAIREEYLDFKSRGSSKSNNLTKDAFGWKGPYSFSWWDDAADIHEGVSTAEENYACLGAIVDEGRNLLVFQRGGKDYLKTNFASRLFVDSASGLPFRQERWREGSPDNKSVTLYRFDRTISIERPTIDRHARQIASLEAFGQSLRLSKESCRQEVEEILRAGSSTLPFEYDLRIPNPHSMISRMSGIFVPPGSLYQKWEGVPTHGDGVEMISISDRLWVKAPWHGWERAEKAKLFPPVRGDLPNDWIGPLIMLSINEAKSANYIGFAGCPAESKQDETAFSVYNYDVFQDVSSERGQINYERTFIARQTMYVERLSRLPVKFETRIGDSKDDFVCVETRRYDKGLEVQKPAGVE